jgi:hypothetical protein
LACAILPSVTIGLVTRVGVGAGEPHIAQRKGGGVERQVLGLVIAGHAGGERLVPQITPMNG